MPNKSTRNDKDKNTSSGQGALGMGGDPGDDPRDLEGGHEELTDDDRMRNVGGASGTKADDHTGGGPSNQVLGVGGDKAVDETT